MKVDHIILDYCGIPLEIAKTYHRRFSEWGVAELVKINCSPELANRYNEKFDACEIAVLVKLDASPEKAEIYLKNFEPEEMIALLKSSCGYECAKLYNSQLNGKEIALLCSRGYSPTDAEPFDERFSQSDKQRLTYMGVVSNEANKYPKRFKGEHIVFMALVKCSPENADEFDHRFDGWNISGLFERKISSEQTNKYDERFSGWDIADLISNNMLPGVANKYNNRFVIFDILHLWDQGILPEEANNYNKIYSSLEISILHAIGITPQAIMPLQEEKINKLFKKIVTNSDIIKALKSCSLIGTGMGGAVFKINFSEFSKPKRITSESSLNETEDLVWKFSLNIFEEYKYLKRIHNKFQGQQKNIIKLMGVPQEDMAVKLEYIHGDSLENIIKQKGILPTDKVLKYSAGIMNGLIEMRTAGIYYHRDIRPANIMIDSDNDKAVIIDLGLATTDRRALPEDNRRFGSAKGTKEDNKPRYANDLTSLGQTMYYLATGMHIFDQSQSMSRTFGSVAEQIDDYRTKVYADETGKLLEMHLKQVEHEIKDERLAQLIKTCLTAKHYQYGKVRRMFERYVR